MMLEIIQGSTKKPVSARRLIACLESYITYDALLYIGYPIICTAEGPGAIDALLVSREKGLVVFNLAEGRDISEPEIQSIQDDYYNKLEAKLRSQKSLMQGRTLQVSIYPVTFAPVVNDTRDLNRDDYPVCNEDSLEKWLADCSWDTPDYYEALVSSLQSISGIRKGRKKRIAEKTDSRGAKLKQLEDSIANLDNLQGRAVIETADGVQRIRGLAGTGKTIILALKVAYLHAQHPDWKIAITFQTRSLKGQFQQFINTFTIEQTNEEPDWENIHILQAWGAPGSQEKNGLYYTFCQTRELDYHDFRSARLKYGYNNAFAGACQEALNECTEESHHYDVILVDEAQDFPPAFLKMCYRLLKPEKRLIYAYDELQSLNAQSLPSPEIIFGQHADGTPVVSFPENAGKPQSDIILKTCYRNSRPVLITAHALGFGIYRAPDKGLDTGLVQIFDQNKLWYDIGYQVKKGKLADGCDVTLSRSPDSSPEFLENHSLPEDLIQFHHFNSDREQTAWIIDAVSENLEKDELRPDDIVIINPDPLTTREAAGPIRKQLLQRGINSHLTGVDTSPDIFFNRNSVAFTSIFRAKGNEAGMVYVINAQDCYTSDNLACVRNQLFTAITRSKAWVRVLGVGDNMRALAQEFRQVQENNFNLCFRYPKEQARKHLNIINRDISENKQRMIHSRKNHFAQLIDDLEAKRVYPEDLGLHQVQRFNELSTVR